MENLHGEAIHGQLVVSDACYLLVSRMGRPEFLIPHPPNAGSLLLVVVVVLTANCTRTPKDNLQSTSPLTASCCCIQIIQILRNRQIVYQSDVICVFAFSGVNAYAWLLN
jgi:hypothetical protein